MNFATLSPVDYNINQPQITPIMKRMSDAITLADLMDSRRDAIKKRKQAEALQQQTQEEYSRRMGAKALLSGTQEPEPPVFNEPVIPATMEPNPAIRPVPSIDFTIPGGAQGQMPEAEVTPPQPSLALSEEGLKRELQQRTESEMGLPLSGAKVQQVPQYQALEPQGQYTPESWDVAHQQNLQKIDYLGQLDKYNKLKERATAVPPEYSWMEPEEYDKYLSRSAISPELGESYLDRLVKTRESLAATGEKKAKTQNLESKLSDMEDISIGNYLEKLPWAEMTPEQRNSVANDLVSSNISPYKALQAVQNPDFYINKAITSPARQALNLKQQELERKKASDEVDRKAKEISQSLQERSVRASESNSSLAWAKFMKDEGKTKEEAQNLVQGELDQANLAKSAMSRLLGRPDLVRKYSGMGASKLLATATNFDEYNSIKNDLTFIRKYMAKDVIKSKILGSQITENDRNFMEQLGAGPGLDLERGKPDDVVAALNRSAEILDNSLNRIQEKHQAIKPSSKSEQADLEYDPKTGTFKKLR